MLAWFSGLVIVWFSGSVLVAQNEFYSQVSGPGSVLVAQNMFSCTQFAGCSSWTKLFCKIYSFSQVYTVYV
jgi:hypothetical protein